MQKFIKFTKNSAAIGSAVFLAACGGGGSTPTATDTSVVYLSGFTSNALTTENGRMGRYSGGPADGWNCTNSGTYCDGVRESATRYYAYYAYPTSGVQQDLYSGIFIQAPGISANDIAVPATLAGVSAANKTKLNFKLGQNAEWYRSSEKNFGVLLTMSTKYSVKDDNSAANCRIKLWQVVTPSAQADTAYSINLSDFRIIESCGNPSLTTAQILSSQTVVQLDFQANAGGARIAATGSQAREGANTTVTNDNADGFTATTISVVAPITFN